MPAAIPTNKNTVMAQGFVPRPLSISQPKPRPAATATTNSKPMRKPTPSALFSAPSFFPSPAAVPLRSRRASLRRLPSDFRSSGVLCSLISRHQRPTRPSRQERQNGANHKRRGGGCQGSAASIPCGKIAVPADPRTGPGGRLLRPHPGDAAGRRRLGLVARREDAMRVIGDEGPAAAILGVAAILLEAEAAVVAPEDIDAAIALGVLPAGQHRPCAAHG